MHCDSGLARARANSNCMGAIAGTGRWRGVAGPKSEPSCLKTFRGEETLADEVRADRPYAIG